MRPLLFHIGSIGVPSFFFMVMIAALASTEYARRVAKREGLSEVAILDLAIIAIIASVIGARLFHVFFEDTALATGDPHYYWHSPIRVFYFWQGGFVSLGAFIFSALGWIIYLWKRKLKVIRYLDVCAVGVPIIIFFVRVGCFLAGCCYGKPTDFFIHLIFKDPGSVAHQFYQSSPLHATQLYAMLNAAIMFLVLNLIYKYRSFYGQIAASFLIYYGFTRFFIEFLRGDVDRGVYFNSMISTGQIVMTGFFVSGVILYIFSRKYYPIGQRGDENQKISYC